MCNHKISAATARRRKENPLWSEILQHSWAKVVKWARRVLDKWNYKISEVVKAGRQPQLRSAAVCAVYRDGGREKEVWRMACLMEHFDEFFKETLTPAQYAALQLQWSSGRLDSRLTPEVLAMRPDFRPHDLAFLFQEMVVEQPTNFLDDGSGKESSAKLEKLLKKLRAEQSAYRRESALRKAADGNYLGLHATWQLKVDEAVDDLFESHQPNYQVFSSPDLSSGHRSLLSARQDLVGLDGNTATAGDKVPSICFWNLPMLGASASTCVQAAADLIASDCAHSPNLNLHVICPPNQASFGKSTDADGSDVADHVERWWSALNEPSRSLSVVKAT